MSITKNYTGLTLQGTTGTSYTVAAAVSGGEGGEGRVYRLRGLPDLAAKIYHEDRYTYPPRDRTYMDRKLKAMLRLHPGAAHSLAWPVDVLYLHGRMVGYVMPLIRSMHKIYDVCRPDSRRQLFPQWSWNDLVKVARNLSRCLALLHQNGIVAGDLNPNNIFVDRLGAVVLIDTDSFDITDPVTREHFPCTVGTAEMLAPELQKVRDLRSPQARFSAQSDDFSLAIYIFLLLMNNYHPFYCRQRRGAPSSSGGFAGNANILRGRCVYLRRAGGSLPPRGAPSFSLLPVRVRVLFANTFSYTERTACSRAAIARRTSAQTWYTALAALQRAPLRRCRRDPSHLYPAHNFRCPWCAAEKDYPSASPAPPPRTAPAGRRRKVISRSTWPLRVFCILAGGAGWLAAAPFLWGWIASLFPALSPAGPSVLCIPGALLGLAAGCGLARGYAHSRRPFPYWLGAGLVCAAAPLLVLLLAGFLAPAAG